MDLARELENVGQASVGDTNYSLCAFNGPQRIGKRIETVGNRRKNRDHSDYSIVEIGQNTEKSPGDLRRRSVAQILMKGHQITLVNEISLVRAQSNKDRLEAVRPLISGGPLSGGRTAS